MMNQAGYLISERKEKKRIKGNIYQITPVYHLLPFTHLDDLHNTPAMGVLSIPTWQVEKSRLDEDK